MQNRFAAAALGILFATASNAAAPNAALVDGDPAAGKAKSIPCQSCHGPDGNSPSPIWPSLADQNATYLKKQLEDFKSGARSDPIMSPMASGLSEQDIKNLAVYYASQQMSKGTASKESLELGEKIYRAGNKETGVPACMACHGPAGYGNPAAAWPRLAGQHSKYIASELKAYRSGERTNGPNAVMQGVAEEMTDEEITAVANYISSMYIVP